MHYKPFGGRAPPGPAILQLSPDTLAGLRGGLGKGEKRPGRGGKGKGAEGKGCGKKEKKGRRKGPCNSIQSRVSKDLIQLCRYRITDTYNPSL